ncbi:hypothetical protein [Kiloniella sp. EL199]|uniref:hypothetical protein n=1 Tax=Kiloniella sp. EL199 TaxID=2107581 RepID=UPI000EA12634|nr:hypothetical protein [Kiloniella sp. EL199]
MISEVQIAHNTGKNQRNKANRKALGEAIDRFNGFIGTATSGVNLKRFEIKPGSKAVTSIDGVDTSFFDDGYVPESLASTSGYKAYFSTAERLFKHQIVNSQPNDYAYPAENNFDHQHTVYGEIQNGKTDFYSMPEPDEHKKNVSKNAAETKRLNQIARDEEVTVRYFTVNERFSRGDLFKVAFTARIVAVNNWAFTDPKEVSETVIGNNVTVFDDYSSDDKLVEGSSGLAGGELVSISNTVNPRLNRALVEYFRIIPGAYEKSPFFG